MTSVCPHGHRSAAGDCGDDCGPPIETPEILPQPDPAAGLAAQPCPRCGAPCPPAATFCESCDHDFGSGDAPRALDPPVPAAAEPSSAPPLWVVELWIDPAWHTAQQSPDPLPSAGPPRAIVLEGRSALVGRVSISRNINPDVDCASDCGVSRRQAQLSTDGTRWWVEDLESANGTFVASALGALPEDPIPVGRKHELAADDQIFVGAWTRLVVRPATDGERA